MSYPKLGPDPAPLGQTGGSAFFSPAVCFWDYSCGAWTSSTKEYAQGWNYAVMPATSKFGPKVIKAWKVPLWRMKQLLEESIMDRSRDRRMINWFKSEIDAKGIVPVRSGHLFSSIFSTMRIKRVARYRNRFWMHCTYDVPDEYLWLNNKLLFIKNPKHSPPSKGYGLHPSKVNTSNLPHNVNLIRTTKTLGLYLLSDSTAQPTPQDYINRLTSEVLYNYMLLLFKLTLIRIHI